MPKDVNMDVRKTILIEKIPKYLCREDMLARYFAEAFNERSVLQSHNIFSYNLHSKVAFPLSRVRVREIYFAYNVEDLMEVDQELRNATMANEYMAVYCKSLFAIRKIINLFIPKPFRCTTLLACPR